MIYLDSSVLLEFYLGGRDASRARAILEEPEPKVASWLMAVEVPIVLRRSLEGLGEGRILARALARFDADLRRVGLVDSLTEVAIRVRSDQRFSRCRAPDAIHACTALLLREWTGHAVRLETLDRRLADLARELHLPGVLSGG